MSCVRRFLNSCTLVSVVLIRGVRGGVRTNVSGTAFSFGLVTGVSLAVGAVEGPKAGDTRLEAGTV